MRRAQDRLPLKPRGDYAHVTRCAWHRATEESEMAQAYCVKDKKKVEIKNAQAITMKNGKPALQGICPLCGGKVFRIGG